MAPLSPDRDRAILDATVELLSEVGYDRMTVDQIAKRARASKATIYRRWAGKPELVVDVICRRLDTGVPRGQDTGSLRGDVASIFGGLCEAVERKHALVIGLSSTLVSDQELARTLRAHLPVRDASDVEALIERAVARGELGAPVDAGRLSGVAEALVWHRMIFTGPVFDEAFVTESVDGVLMPLITAWSA
ncbi:TetR/AcrR family transcriptional regulator [Nonomuraea gerenzanensis]|uniref:Transcriptional regulator, TetR family n=1 Tax=Nonomuraea gerenzanensis TaxID=93944 RepID=A0A1M4EGW6_9ACTN|nr:TetR/AcrR family transcriptional regulator [Nonomuraea gerenzanensis]UBU09768.1 TetR/AcrR family transcriptional regulator [Nonomuraea gerenzanensis]SBO98211.1 Transcriptional regulator, TetR family [Nonomuraea gerenzanensis]